MGTRIARRMRKRGVRVRVQEKEGKKSESEKRKAKREKGKEKRLKRMGQDMEGKDTSEVRRMMLV